MYVVDNACHEHINLMVKISNENENWEDKTCQHVGYSLPDRALPIT